MWSKAVQKLRSHRLLGPRKRKTIGDHQDVQKNLNRGNVAKRFLRSFKLISCTAADYKFLFRTSKCFSKIEITVPRSKSERAVRKVGNQALNCIRLAQIAQNVSHAMQQKTLSQISEITWKTGRKLFQAGNASWMAQDEFTASSSKFSLLSWRRL